MAEWHLTPEYILSNWTHELLEIMTEKLIARKTPSTQTTTTPQVSDAALFALLGNNVKVIRIGN